MLTERVTSKRYIPPLLPNLVPRPHLVQILKKGLYTKRKPTLVAAPAGYGKTTPLVDWLGQIDRPAAWLSLDNTGIDLPRFLVYIAAAFRQVDEYIGTPLPSALQSPRLPRSLQEIQNA